MFDEEKSHRSHWRTSRERGANCFRLEEEENKKFHCQINFIIINDLYRLLRPLLGGVILKGRLGVDLVGIDLSDFASQSLKNQAKDHTLTDHYFFSWYPIFFRLGNFQEYTKKKSEGVVEILVLSVYSSYTCTSKIERAVKGGEDTKKKKDEDIYL